MHAFIDGLHDFGELLAHPAIITASMAIGLLWVLSNRYRRKTAKQSLMVFGAGFLTGVREEARGYFAPLRAAPWQRAYLTARTPGTTLRQVFCAWFGEVERIVTGHS